MEIGSADPAEKIQREKKEDPALKKSKSKLPGHWLIEVSASPVKPSFLCATHLDRGDV